MLNPVPKLVPTIYWIGDYDTINISGTTYIAEQDKINIDGAEYYQLKLDKDLNNDFYNFNYNPLTNLIFKDVDTSNVTDMNYMFSGCSSLKTIRMVGCSQDTIDKIKAQLSTDGITGCTIVTE